MNNPKTLPPPPEAWTPPPERWFDRYEFPAGGDGNSFAELSKLGMAMRCYIHDRIGAKQPTSKLMLVGNLRDALVSFVLAHRQDGVMSAFREKFEENANVGVDPEATLVGILIGRKNRK